MARMFKSNPFESKVKVRYDGTPVGYVLDSGIIVQSIFPEDVERVIGIELSHLSDSEAVAYAAQEVAEVMTYERTVFKSTSPGLYQGPAVNRSVNIREAILDILEGRVEKFAAAGRRTLFESEDFIEQSGFYSIERIRSWLTWPSQKLIDFLDLSIDSEAFADIWAEDELICA